MRRARAWLLRFAGLFRRRRWERALNEELESHLQMHIDDGMRSGLTPVEARRQAVLKLGGLEATKESYRDRRGIPWLETLARDVAYGFRMMRRSPGFTATVVCTLALGIGATTAIFTVVNGVLLRPLPYPDPDRLVYIGQSHGGSDSPFTYTWDFASWRQHSRSLSRIAGYMSFSANLVGSREAERIIGGLATESLLPLLGVQPALGRNFLPQEDRPGGPLVVILAHAFWKRCFGADPAVLGKSLTLDAKTHTVVGVLPAGFRIPDRYSGSYDLWVPFAISDTGKARDIMLHAVGRLNSGVSLETARAELDTLQRKQLRKGVKKTVTMMRWQEQVASGARRSLIIFLCAVGFVLLIACVNVANLLLSRGAAREREIGVRLALGAGRKRVIRQLLTESVLTGLLGGILALALAHWGKNLLLTVIAPKLPALDPIALDYRVSGFNLGLALLTGLAFGLAPAFQASKVQVSHTLKESARGAGEGRSTGRLRSFLVISEVALAMVLLSGAGLLLKSFLKLRGIDMGFRPDRMLVFDLNLTTSQYPKPQDQARFLAQALERLRSVPGVQSVAAGTCLPLTGAHMTYTDLAIEGHPGTEYDISSATVSPAYFRAMGIPLIRGRYLSDADREGSPGVVVVNQAFARRFLSGGTDLGRHIEDPNRKNHWLTIVGIVGDVRGSPAGEPEPEMYLSYFQPGDSQGTWASGTPMTFVARAVGNPLSLAAAVRSEIAAVDKTQPPHGLATLEERRAESIAPRRVTMLLIAAFAALALALGSIGIYGVLAYTVGRRTHEIGVRMAFGARRGQILGLVLRQGIVLIATGVAIGLLAALGLTRVIASELWGVSATDPWTFVAVAAVLAASGLAACALPARRATKVDPMLALRYE